MTFFFHRKKLDEKCPEHMGNPGSKMTVLLIVVLVVLKSCFVKGQNCGKWFDSIWYKDVAGLVYKVNVVGCQGELKIWYQTDSTLKLGLQVMHFLPLN